MKIYYKILFIFGLSSCSPMVDGIQNNDDQPDCEIICSNAEAYCGTSIEECNCTQCKIVEYKENDNEYLVCGGGGIGKPDLQGNYSEAQDVLCNGGCNWVPTAIEACENTNPWKCSQPVLGKSPYLPTGSLSNKLTCTPSANPAAEYRYFWCCP